MNKTMFISAALAVALGAGWYACSKPAAPATTASATPAAALTGKEQVFEITVKEGYLPKEITAKAGTPVVLKMKTSGTFDCSSTFLIPKLNVREALPATGEKLILIPAQPAGATIQGTCGMGMYALVVKYI